MGLSASLAIASSGLAAVQAEMAVASQNVANASTAGYAAEAASVSSRSAGGSGSGVVVGLTGRTVDTALESSLYGQNATVSALSTMDDALSTVSALQGSTDSDSGSSATLADDVGNLQSSLITLESDPDQSAGQSAVVHAAGSLAATIQNTAAAYTAARQSAQESIVSEVGSVNSNLSSIGSLSDLIVQYRTRGISTADLENQRSAVMTTLSQTLSVSFKETATGDMLVNTVGGLALPTHDKTGSGPLATADATLTAESAYPAAVPAITLDGRDVTTQLTGGTLGANVALRDQVFPTMQAELDSFSQSLATRFDSQGLTLFTDASGSVAGSSPIAGTPTGQLGFSSVIQVNAAVTADPSLVRDGTHDVAGSATGAAAFAVNSTRGSADTTLINRLVTYALGVDAQAGVPQPAAATTGLGANGTLSAPYSGVSTLAELASSLTSAQASTINDNTTELADQTAIQTSISTKVTAVSGVSVDDEMVSIVNLQNAYSANAKIVSAVQSMFTALLAALS